MKDILNFLNENISAIIGIMAILGISIEVAPVKINPITWFFKKVNKHIYDDLEKLKNNDEEYKVLLLETKKELWDGIANNRKQSDLHFMKQYRNELIAFAENLHSNRCYSKDIYRSIFEKYNDYEKLVEKYGLVNGHTDNAIKAIEEHYRKCILNSPTN